jgi:hypothetical protein
MELHRANFAVLSYNNGQVNCSVTPDRREEFITTAWKLGMVPPVYEISRQFGEAELAALPWGGDANSKFLAALVLRKNTKALWALDLLPLAASEKEKQEILLEVQDIIVKHR